MPFLPAGRRRRTTTNAPTPSCRLPRRMLPGFALSVLRQRTRSFSHDATRAVAGLRPPVEVAGRGNVPPQGPCLVTCNHYSPEWFPSWWLTLTISAAVAAQRTSLAEVDIHWIMAAAWRYPAGTWRGRLVTPATWWAFSRVGRVYGFVLMPPMPPDPREVEDRAWAVRRALRMARELAQVGGMMGLSPEGIAVRDAALVEPPPGVGEFIAHLVCAGLPVLPVGVREVGGRLRVSFGPLFKPELPARREERDRSVTGQVMEAIGRQLA